MPKKTTIPPKPRIVKNTLTFGKQNQQGTLILQCQCGRSKSFTVLSVVGEVERKFTQVGSSIIGEYGNTVVTVGTSYLQWSCLHEDEQ